MKDCVGTHLMKRLRHRLERDAIDRAVDAEILLAATWDVEGVQVRGFTAHPQMLERTPREIERLLARLGAHEATGRSGAASMDFDDNTFVMTDNGIRPLQKGTGKHSPRPSKARRSNTVRYRRLTARLLREVRQSAGRPHPADVATVLLLARAVAGSEIPLAEVLRILRTPRPIITVVGSVSGFENAILNLLAQGLILPGKVGLVRGHDLGGGRTVRFSSPGTDRWQVVMFSGNKFDPDEPDRTVRLVDRAALMEHPILGIAEAEERLPEQLSCAAQLRLFTGPLDANLVRKVITIVLGEEPEGSLPDETCALLTLSDLSIAIRPGVAAAAVLGVLRQIAAMKDVDLEEESGKRGDSNARQGSSSSKRTSKSGRGDPGSGSEIIQPVPMTDTDSDRFIARVETLSGYGQATEWALSLKADLELWRAGELAWEEMSTRLLLSGPPGTGKTTFAKALCNSLQVPLIATSVATWLEPGYFGDVLLRMKAAFAEAESLKPAILFVDELDGIGIRRQRGEWVDYSNGIINRALELLDGATRSSGVIVVAATNHPQMIDPALLRSGRLETHIEIPSPDTDALVGILRHHLKDDLDAIVASAPAGASMGAGAEGLGTVLPVATADRDSTDQPDPGHPEAAAERDGLEEPPEVADGARKPATTTTNQVGVRDSVRHAAGDAVAW